MREFKTAKIKNGYMFYDENHRILLKNPSIQAFDEFSTIQKDKNGIMYYYYDLEYYYRQKKYINKNGKYEPTYKWIDINGTKAVEIKYRRSGTDNNTTACTLYLLFNDDEAVKMIVSYREKAKALWLPDFDNIVKTFKWK